MKSKVNNLNRINEVMKRHHGYITSSELDKMEIHRMYLQMLLRKKLIRKVETGVYLDINKVNDKLYSYRLWNDHFIYSHMTALYLYDYINVIPGKYDITVISDYHNPKLVANNIFYVNKDIYSIGRKRIKTKQGNYAYCYDLERTICDLIRSIKRLDKKIVKKAVIKYLSSKECNINKVCNYARKLNVYDEVNKYLLEVKNE